jgi:hypothetical protein
MAYGGGEPKTRHTGRQLAMAERQKSATDIRHG